MVPKNASDEKTQASIQLIRTFTGASWDYSGVIGAQESEDNSDLLVCVQPGVK
jgi:hypothetical protein